MGFLNQISRRNMMAGQAALAGLAIFPGRAASHTGSATPNGAATGSPADCLPARWHNATADELAGFVGDRFRVRSRDHGDLVLKLVAVESHQSGESRPGNLPRREGVTLVFDSVDMAPLVRDGYGVHRVSHPRIGSAELFMSASPRRGGGNYVDVVLN